MARSRKDYGFSAIRIEGGILPPEYLQTINALGAKKQGNADYGLTKSLNIKDEIGRYWRMASDLWNDYKERRCRTDLDPTKVAIDEWLRPLFENILGYHDIAPVAAATIGERRFPVGHKACGGAVPLVLAGHIFDLDRAESRFGEDGRRRPPHGLLQEYLNADDACLWGIAANGNLVRLARDNPSLTRPAFIEADLERMFEEQLFADFAAFWLTFHVSRLAPQDGSPSACVLETWRTESIETGERAREKLREGVTLALRHFGNGFLEHPDNEALRKALSEGRLTDAAYFQELLRLVYRLLFLFTVEDRDLLFHPGAQDEDRRLFGEGYSVSRLRDRALKRRHYDQYGDLWDGLRIVFSALGRGAKPLGLPALGGLFADYQCPHLDRSSIANDRLLQAIRALAFFESGKALARVNYRDMGTEELGSVYESLLDLRPTVSATPWSFGFTGDNGEGSAKGSERKLTGSYYTPPTLVNELIKSALVPVIERTLKDNPGKPREAVLALKIVDPACGSGHFLLAAARQLAAEVARIDAGPDTPGEQLRQHALREVVQHCIYGVDRNPLAVELCKTALWIETVEPGKPLTFFDSHIRCGDSLIGVFDLSVLRDGIPDEAYKPLTGDHKDAAAYYRKKNSTEMRERAQADKLQGALDLTAQPRDLARALEALEAMPEDSVADIEAKRRTFQSLQSGGFGWKMKIACDLWCAPFFATKAQTPQRGQELVSTSGHVWQYLDGITLYGPLIAETNRIATQSRFFHWPLEFPDVFACGGFDVALGNPPWETMSPDAKEFFATYDPQVRFMSPEDQKAAFARLLETPVIASRWESYCRELYMQNRFFRNSERYRLFAGGALGGGDLNLYRMFVETALDIAKPGGHVTQIVPDGLYNGANTTAIRRFLLDECRLTQLIGFQNLKRLWFPEVYYRMKFCLYTAIKGGKTETFKAAFGMISQEQLSSLHEGSRLDIPVSLIKEFSPEAMAIMEFAAQEDINICRKMYERYPKFGETIDDLPYRSYMAEVHMGNNRDLFVENSAGLPLFEGRMVDAYDYRAKQYLSGRGRASQWLSFPFGDQRKVVVPQWYIETSQVPESRRGRVSKYRVGFCDVASSTNERSLIAALIPPNAICGHKVPTILFDSANCADMLLWLGIANSLTMDFVVRKKVALQMSYTIMDSLPFPRDRRATPAADEILARAFALTIVGPEMQDFHRLVEKEGTMPRLRPAVEDLGQRARLTAEIDALVARSVYGLTRDEMRYILDPADFLGEGSGVETFKALRNREIREFGEYRTRRLVLEAWDRLEAGSLHASAAE